MPQSDLNRSGRTPGSRNITIVNKSKAFREAFSDDDLRALRDKLMDSAMNAKKISDSNGAIKIILDKIIVSADKETEAEVNSLAITSAKQAGTLKQAIAAKFGLIPQEERTNDQE